MSVPDTRHCRIRNGNRKCRWPINAATLDHASFYGFLWLFVGRIHYMMCAEFLSMPFIPDEAGTGRRECLFDRFKIGTMAWRKTPTDSPLRKHRIPATLTGCRVLNATPWPYWPGHGGCANGHFKPGT
jgi:hypothetical protein